MVEKVSRRINSPDSQSVEPKLDVLSDVLDTMRFRGSIFFRSKLASPWGMSLEALETPRFHIALSGSCFLGVDESNDGTINLKEMDIVMIPHGKMHWIADKPDRKLTPSRQAGDACELGTPLFQNGEITNRLICGVIDYDKEILHPILDSLPSALHFSGIKHNDPIWMTVLLIDAEMESSQSRHTSIIDRLTEVLFLQLIGRHTSEDNYITGFFAALGNQRVHKALELIHKNPQYQWSLDSIAERVNMSRATLIRQFNNTLGVRLITFL